MSMDTKEITFSITRAPSLSFLVVFGHMIQPYTLKVNIYPHYIC